MSKCDELRKLLLEWGKDNYLPLKKKIAYLENENYRLRMQNLRIKERNEKLTLIVKKRRKEAEICSDCNMDFEDFMRNKPVAGRDTNDR